MDRRDWLTVVLMLPFVASLPYLLPPPEAGWGRVAVAVGYTLMGSLVARFVAGRLSRK
jgi:hypothetical protein